MRPFTRRTVGSLAVVLAFGVPALSAAAVPGSGTARTAPSAAHAGTACDPDGVATSFVLDPARVGMVTGISVSGISPACNGHEVTVVVAGIPGRVLVDGARATVELEQWVPAQEVGALTVAITPS